MEQRICPDCKRALPKDKTRCQCGYHEVLSDDELWRRIESYTGRYNLCLIPIVIGLILFFIGVFTLSDGAIGILVLLLGIALLVFGIGMRSNMHSRQSRLINEQLGEFFKDEYVRTFGAVQKLPKTNVIKEEILRSGLYENWTNFSASQAMEGSYQGMFYRVANVSLTRVEEREIRNSDGTFKTEQTTTDVFGGIWIHVRQSRSVECLVRVQERTQKRSGKYDHKKLQGNIELENSSLNEKYAITSDSQQAALYVLTPQFMEQLETLDAKAEAKTSVAFVGGEIFFGLETDRQLLGITAASAASAKGVNDIKEGYRAALRYQAELLDIIGRSPFIQREGTASHFE